MTRVLRNTTWVLVGIMWATACASADSLADAARSYLKNHDYASLQVIAAHLRKGMPRKQAEAWLGSPHMEVSEGSCVYGSDRVVYVEEAERELPVVLIVEYRDESGQQSRDWQVTWWKLTWIGE